MNDSGFYRAFEDLHRGSGELIQTRLAVYLPFVRATAQLLPGAMVTDLGCGRGEWLGLLQQNGVRAQGVDLDEGMLADCRELGLEVRREDALAFLGQLPDNSQAVVSGFHIAEHLPFPVLQSLVQDALRVLRPGGLLILETPNPENLAVGTAGFYMDPTHERPLPAPLLAFLPQFYGYCRVKTLRLQEGPALRGRTRVTLVDVLAGVSPDYAVIAQKTMDVGAADPAGLAALEAAFAQEHGVTLNELAERHERQSANRQHHAQSVAEASRSAALAAQAANTRALDQVAALEQKVLDHVARLQNELLAAQGSLADMHASRSWRITRPMRWLGEQRIALREQGALARASRLARKLARAAARTAIRAADRSPRLRKLAVRAIRSVGLGDVAARAWARFGNAAVAAPPETPAVTPAAARVHEALKRALSRRAAAPPAETPH